MDVDDELDPLGATVKSEFKPEFISYDEEAVKSEPVSDDDSKDVPMSDSDYECEGDDDEDDGSEEEDADWPSTAASVRVFEFTKEEMFLVPFPVERRPIDFFNLMLDQHFLDHIVDATNQNAIEVMCRPTTTHASRITRWKDVTAEELKVFIGLFLHMGFVKMPSLRDYWKTTKLIVSCFRNFMSRDRFLLILRCLDFDTEHTSMNKASRVKFLVDYFNKKMAEIYYPGKNLCIDEPMVILRGRLHFGLEKDAPGIKLYTLCEPLGFILKFLVSCGPCDEISPNLKSIPRNVVLKLLEGKLDRGHSVYMTDHFSRFKLATYLLRRRTYATGHLKLDLKTNPGDVELTKLRKDESISRQKGGVLVGKWKWADLKNVSYITTEFGNQMVKTQGISGKEREEPQPIAMYNKLMRDSSRWDQITAHYPGERLPMRWDRKVFVHVLQMLLMNSFYLYEKVCKEDKRKLSLYDFRLAVVDSLLPNPRAPPKVLETKHVPRKVEEKKGTTNRRRQKRCRACQALGIEKRVVWHCLACEGQPGLCVPMCFEAYHLQ